MRLVWLSLEHDSLLLDLTSCLQLDPAVLKVNDVRWHLNPIVPTSRATIPLRLVSSVDRLRVGGNVGGVRVSSSRLGRVLLLHLLLHQI